MFNKSTLKILSIGNSFAVDTTEYATEIALDLGFQSVYIGTLYIGGCSINRHYENAQNNSATYTYYVNNGEGWRETPNVSIEDAIKSEEWDFISIQHGTGDGSRYTLDKSYEKLPALIEYVRGKVSPKTEIAFNMAWVMDSNSTHPEIRSYEGNQSLMYEKLVHVTKHVVKPTKGLDVISPVGTAVQNARISEKLGNLCRDGFHLSYTKGRYIAAMTFICALTKKNPKDVYFIPEGVDNEDKAIIKECVANAIKSPFNTTKI